MVQAGCLNSELFLPSWPPILTPKQRSAPHAPRILSPTCQPTKQPHPIPSVPVQPAGHHRNSATTRGEDFAGDDLTWRVGRQRRRFLPRCNTACTLTAHSKRTKKKKKSMGQLRRVAGKFQAPVSDTGRRFSTENPAGIKLFTVKFRRT